MSKALNSLIDYLKGNKDAWQPTTTTFPRVDVDQLAKDLGLISKGQNRAKNPIVAVDSVGHDAVEREIIENIVSRARGSLNDYNTALDMYEARLRYAAVDDAAFVHIQSSAEEALANFKAQVVEEELSLHTHEENLRLINRQYNEFVKSNRLQNVAPVTISDRQLTHGWLWIGAIVLIEAILNGLFFAQGSEFGLIGGIVEAFLLSIINISLAAFIGLYSLRYIKHVSILQKLLALLSLAGLVVCVFSLNLLIAHYRDAFVAYSAQHVQFAVVLESFRNTTFNLHDGRSWLLGCFGIILNCIAIYKFYHFQDPYPGYGYVAKRRDETIKRLDSERRHCIEILTHHRTDALADMKEIISIISARHHEFELVLRSRERLHRLFKEHLEELTSVAAMLGMIYHNEFVQENGNYVNKRLSIKLDPPPELHSVASGDGTSHKRAIDTMSEYINKINHEYGLAVEYIGDSTRIDGESYAST